MPKPLFVSFIESIRACPGHAEEHSLRARERDLKNEHQHCLKTRCQGTLPPISKNMAPTGFITDRPHLLKTCRHAQALQKSILLSVRK